MVKIESDKAQVETASGSCCSKKASIPNEFLDILDKVCRVVLAVFSCLVNPFLFSASFALGSLAAIVYVFATRGGDQDPGTLKPLCGQGYLEFLSGKVFPQWVLHVVTTAFIAAHVRHDPVFFVPFCGLAIGWYGGSNTGTALWSLTQRTLSYWQPPKKSCCSA